MDKFIQTICLRELNRQCDFALNAAQALNNVMPRLGANDTDVDTRDILNAEVFRTIHSFLTHASNASKILWPSARNAKSRGEHLRQILDIEYDHALSSRILRNHLEHFDERMDDWAKTSVDKNFVQDIIGPSNMIAGVNPEDCMRWYDPRRATMFFRGNSYDIQELANGLQDVRERVAPHLIGQWP